MKLMQVFDCTDMPRDVKKAFFERNEGKGNDTYVTWSINDRGYGDEEDAQIALVDKWLLTQHLMIDSEVLISHWW